MRKIKFRGKSLESHEWVYGSLITNEAHTDNGKFMVAFIVPGLPCASDGGDFYTARMWRVDASTVGQFTGLLDKEGREIYEGDIIKVGDEKTLLEVRFVRGVFSFLWNGDLDDEFPCNAPTHEWAEVVGNVHDNQEHLKQ